MASKQSSKQSDDDKDLEKVREIRDENERHWATHERTIVEREVQGVTKEGSEKSKPIEVKAYGGEVHINSHGHAVLDKEGVITLRQALDAAFQAVA